MFQAHGPSVVLVPLHCAWGLKVIVAWGETVAEMALSSRAKCDEVNDDKILKEVMMAREMVFISSRCHNYTANSVNK